MTGFALGDKFIGVSTDNIYTKQELDTKLQDKQDTLIAGQGIDISEDGTISSNTNLDVSNPLELAYPQLPNHGISLNDDGTFRRIAGATNQYSIPCMNRSSNKITFAASNLSGQTNNTIPIDNYDAAYAQWEANATIIHEMLLVNEGSSSPRECIMFGNLEDGTFTMKAYIGFLEAGSSEMQTFAVTFTSGSWDNKLFTPSGIESGGSSNLSYGVRGQGKYCKFGLNEGGNYAFSFYDKATNTLQEHIEYTKGDFKTVVQSCNCVLLPFGYVDYESNARLHYDPEYNKVLSSTGAELWTATIPNTSETPTLQLNYDSTLTLNGDNLGVNTSNLGLATVATTGSYTDLTNTPEEYVLPTASTDTLGGVKVDGTSIVIAEGVISTNTGTGVDTYTKTEIDNKLNEKQDTITFGQGLSFAKIVSQISSIVDNEDGTYVGILQDTNSEVIPKLNKTYATPNSLTVPTTSEGNKILDGGKALFYTGSITGKTIMMGDAPVSGNETPNNATVLSQTITLGNVNNLGEFIPKYLFFIGYNGTLSPSYAYYRVIKINNAPSSNGQNTPSTWDSTATTYTFNTDDYEILYTKNNTASSSGIGQDNRPWKITLGSNTAGNLTFDVQYPCQQQTANNIDTGITLEQANELNCVLFTIPYYSEGNCGRTNFTDTGIFDGVTQIWTPTPQSTSQVSNLSVNYDNSSIKVNDNGQLYADVSTLATKEELNSKLDITKCSNIPVGLEHSISSGILTVQPGYVKSKLGQIVLDEALTTADISNVQTGADNGVILGDVTTQRTLEINENTGKYLFFAGTDANQQNNMVEDNRGSWIFASSSQGKNSTTCPYYGFIFNEEQPAGNYSVTINIISGWINISLAKGTIGNLTNLNTDTSSAGIKTFDFEVSEPFSTIYVYYGNYYNFQVAYDCKITQTVSATEFSTYLCVKDGTQSIKLLNDTTELASYTDYAKIGKVIYDVTLANPAAFPSQDLANKYLSGGLEVPSLNNVITNKTLKNYIKQGDNVTITPESDGSLTISSTGGTVGDNVITSDNISQNEYIKQLEARIAALETALDGGNSLGEIITNTVIQTAGTPAGGQNSGYVGTQTITVQDLETS